MCDEKPKKKTPTSDRITRSKVEKFEKELCFFCQSEDTVDLINMSSFDNDTKVRAAIQTDQELNIRYNAAVKNQSQTSCVNFWFGYCQEEYYKDPEMLK